VQAADLDSVGDRLGAESALSKLLPLHHAVLPASERPHP
jgi:hypothetical protein